MISLILTTTGSATAIGLIYPECWVATQRGAIRVRLLTGPLRIASSRWQGRRMYRGGRNGLLRAAAEVGSRALGYEERPLVSVDYLNDPRSAIVMVSRRW